MKRIRIILPLLLLLALPGCVTTTPPASITPPAALAPGFSNQADQTMDQVLVGARKFYTDIQAQVVAGYYLPSPMEKTSLNSFAASLNTAQALYKAYHAGTATQAQAQAAVTTVVTQQTAIQNALGGK